MTTTTERGKEKVGWTEKGLKKEKEVRSSMNASTG